MNLARQGYAVTCAYDGQEAADLLENNTFDLVLLDIMLPKFDGYDLLSFIRPLGIPVIFLTAKADVMDRVKGLGSRWSCAGTTRARAYCRSWT